VGAAGGIWKLAAVRLAGLLSGVFRTGRKTSGPVLELGLEHARQLAGQISISNLIADLSQGVRFTEDWAGN